MTTNTVNDIALEDSTGTDVTVSLTVEAEDDTVADQMVIDLRDRAYRVAQAIEQGAKPADMEKHPASMNWESFAEDDEEDNE